MHSTLALRSTLALCALSSLAAAQTRFTAPLSGASQVPPVVSAGAGSVHARLDLSTSTLTVNVATSGLAGTDTGAQVAMAPAGVTGPVVFALAGGAGTWSGSAVLGAGDVAALLGGNLYVEVLTSVVPTGELRGQLGLPAIVINEFAYDDTGTDDREFVELYNRSSAPVDISGWRLEAQDLTTTNPTYTVPAATTLAAGDYYVFGSTLLSTLFPGVVDQNVGANDRWENDNESLTIKNTFGHAQDSLVYEANKGIGVLAQWVEGEGVWGNYTLTEANPTSIARMLDGLDSDDNRDFHVRPWTPGANNAIAGAKPYCDDFETLAVGTSHPAFAGSFVVPRVIDPTSAVSGNPNAIAASPLGGKALIAWDPSGGGNAGVLASSVHGPDILVETWIYFDTTLELTAPEREAWSVGIQGSTCGFYNFGDPSGSLAAGFNTNGNTGLAWTFEVTNTSAVLYLYDHNNGAWVPGATTPPISLGSINLTGQPSGWRRLRLQVAGTAVNGWFEGDFGSTTTGTQLSGTSSQPYAGPAGVYIGYREIVVNNATLRPPTMDGFVVGHPANAAVFGSSSPTTAGRPLLCASSPASLGNAGHALELRNVTAAGLPAALFFDFFPAAPIDLSGIGAQPGAIVLVLPGVSIVFGTSGTGLDSIPAPVPFDPLLLGVDLFWQGLVIDPSLAFTLPVATSWGFRERIH